MPYNGSGTFLPANEYPVVTGDVIRASDFNSIISDIYSGLSLALTRDGQSSLQGPFNTGGNPITNLGGSVSFPAIRFNANDGFYSTTNGSINVSIFGTYVGSWTINGYTGSLTNCSISNCVYTGSQDFTSVSLLVATQSTSDNSQKVATTAFVHNLYASMVAPGSIPQNVMVGSLLFLAANFV